MTLATASQPSAEPLALMSEIHVTLARHLDGPVAYGATLTVLAASQCGIDLDGGVGLAAVADRVGLHAVADDLRAAAIPAALLVEAAVSVSAVGQSPELLGQVADRFGHDTTAARKDRGAFFTPQLVAAYLASQALSRFPESERPTVLDPACGGGALLLAALDALADRQDARTAGHRLAIVEHQLFGVDLDRRAVEVARASLLAAVIGGDRALHSRALGVLEANVTVGDGLAGGDQLSLLAKQQASARGVYDIVLANPPYVSFSGRQARSADGIGGARAAGGGWPSAHARFLEHAVTTASRRVVAFVLPDQVGHLAGYGPVREIVTRHSQVVDVRYWGENVFDGVISPILTLIADREADSQCTITDRAGRRGRVDPTGSAQWIAHRHGDLLDRIRKGSWSLGACVRDPGVHTGNCAARLLAPLESAPRSWVPVLEGRDVARYRCGPPRKALALDYRPGPGEYFRIAARERYAEASFVIRQTAPHPIVGPRRHATYFRNSLLALYPPPGVDIRYVVGLLNSRLLRFVYQATVAESAQRAFPQVKVGALRSLPLRTAGTALRAAIVELVERMLDLEEGTELDRLDAELDWLVFDLYGLTGAERVIVAHELDGPAPRTDDACGSGSTPF